MLTAKKITSAMIIAGAMVVSTNAFAWSSYSGHGSYSDGSSDGYGNEWSYSSDSTSVTVSAWSNNATGKGLEAADLKHSTYNGGGYMVENHDSSDEYGDQYQYVDSNTHMDSVLFDYGEKCVVLDEVVLSTVKYGSNGDADVTVMAYLGSKTGKEFKDYLAGKKYEDLVGSNEWKVFNVDDVQDHAYTTTSYMNSTTEYKKKFNETDKIAASHWLVMANGNKDGENDYFKIKHMGGYDYTDGGTCGKVVVKCTPPTHDVPEPQSLALLGLGLLGLVATRRRKA